MQANLVHNLPVKRAHMINRIHKNRRNTTDISKLIKYTKVLDETRQLKTCPPNHHFELRYSVIFVLTQVNGRTAKLKEIGPRGLWRATDKEETGDTHDNSSLPIYTQKYCGVLTAKQFQDLCDNFYMEAQSHETMGMFGAPGFGISWTPAIPFQTDDHDWYNDTVYVFPFVVAVPNNKKRIKFSDCALVATNYNKLEKAIRNKFTS